MVDILKINGYFGDFQCVQNSAKTFFGMCKGTFLFIHLHPIEAGHLMAQGKLQLQY